MKEQIEAAAHEAIGRTADTLQQHSSSLKVRAVTQEEVGIPTWILRFWFRDRGLDIIVQLDPVWAHRTIVDFLVERIKERIVEAELD